MAVLAIAGGAAGCGRQSILTTRSKPAHDIALLWWWMLAAATIVFVGAVAMLVVAWIRRGAPGLPFVGEREGLTQGLVLVFGIAVPIVVLVVLFGFSDVYLVGQTSPPLPSRTRMTIDVIGHQWWWEIRYPGEPVGHTGSLPERAVTANELHIPVDTRVNIVATSADVIHSFWVPALNRKIDMIPGRRNRVLLYADRPGEYRGQCSQFCGLQHAHMSLYVFAQTPARFRTWLANQATPAAAPASAVAQAGQRQFMADQCASCHTIDGTAARGTVGPNLTHLASRTSLAAAEIPNTPRRLTSWIRNPQAIKPGDRMPDLGLGSRQVSELVTYLDGLR
ncbi:cytochrome c oxidase subunit II [Mycobacterium sp.]|uniref:cytochrome c oxidase subunit II n=1 Tax=Mycobacterium sp. TaxID=1785 RepID=UPI003BAFBC32